MKQLFSLIFLLLSSLSLFAQEKSPAETVHDKLNLYQRLRPTEKTYLHTDKNMYSPGETIWFKAYLADGSTHQPGTQSTVLYVELRDPLRNMIAKRNILAAGGTGKGDILLSDSLSSGNYELIAYTRYMGNNDFEQAYRQNIMVTGPEPESHPLPAQLAPSSSDPESQQVVAPLISLQFFAEGGELVNGLQNRLAFKAVNGQGKGIDLKGIIINKKGDSINTFSTQKFGMGDLLLKPSAPEAPYSAVVNHRGSEYFFLLPEVKESGFGLSIRNHQNKVYLKATHTNPEEMEGSFIAGHIRGRPFASITAEKNTEEIYAALPTDSLPEGVAHFTLFNKEGVPQLERLVYINNPAYNLSLQIETDQSSYGTRSEAGFSLLLTDAQEVPVSGSLSATVVDKSLLDGFKAENNIRSYFLLTSDLKGKIENPAYYFKPENKDRFYLLDLLMLTQGWRKFTWKEVLQKPVRESAIQAEAGFTIQGQLSKYYRQKKETEGIVTLGLMEDLLFSKKDTTTENGRFSFHGLHFMDTVKFILQADKIRKKDKKGNDALHIALDSAPVSAGPGTSVLPSNKAAHSATMLAEYEKKLQKIKEIDSAYAMEEGTILLNEVSVEAKKKEEDPFDRPGMMYWHPRKRLVPDSMSSSTAFNDIYDILQGSMAGLRVVGAGMERTVLIRNMEPLFVLDGMRLDKSLVSIFPPSDIAFVDILTGPETMLYRMNSVGPVVVIYTRRYSGDANVKKEVPGIINFKHPGYYLAREFYVPDYSEKDEAHAKPDFRSTLYWNPDIFIDEDGQTSFDFFTSDEKEEYILLIEGITADGRLITGEKSFKVE